MLIGLATLISILFFGGVGETFLVDKLEKGVKQHIVNKETRKEILADLKLSKKYIKTFNKKRSAQLKSFKEMNADRETKREDLDIFFETLHKERLAFQEYIIGERIRIAKKIKPDEWTLMMAISDESVSKRQEKYDKKVAKGKIGEPFEKTRQAIIEQVLDTKKKQKLLASLEDLNESGSKMAAKLAAMNVKDNEVIANPEVSGEKLTEVSNRLNMIRKQVFDELIDFHFAVKQQTNEEEWKAVMKSFNKELTISSH